MNVVSKYLLVLSALVMVVLFGVCRHYKNESDQLSLALANTEQALEQAKATVQELQKRVVVADDLRAKYIAKEKELALLKRHYNAKFKELQNADPGVANWADQPLPDALLQLHKESRGSGSSGSNSTK